MVTYVARHLKRRFYQDIRARAAGFRPPEQLSQQVAGTVYLPDVTMLAKGHEFHVLEVETRDSLQARDTQDKWRALAEHATSRGGRFWVVVPRGARPLVESKLASLDLEARVWEV
jgi:hypothetical protein